jgi:hypothetical protein
MHPPPRMTSSKSALPNCLMPRAGGRGAGANPERERAVWVRQGPKVSREPGNQKEYRLPADKLSELVRREGVACELVRPAGMPHAPSSS